MSNIRGYCAAVADVSRMGNDDIASELLDNSGVCLDDLIKEEVEEYDLDEIKKLPWPNKYDGQDVQEGNDDKP